ncbi:MAG: hypothetical protein AAB706_02485 [Patescibacteria group bacterium]
MTGIDKLRQQAEKLKAETEEKAEADVQETAIVKSQLDMVRGNPELAKMYTDNARVGSENLGGTLPTLSIYTVGKSKSLLANGSKPNDGAFFYAPTREQFPTVDAHILTISHGFRAPDMNGVDKFNQIMGGVIVSNGKQLPFIMFVRGIRLQPMWDFGKEAGKYTHAKPVSIPMFALTVHLTQQSVPSKFGDNWKVIFKILHDEEEFPILVTDTGEFQFLRDMVDVLNETIDKLIEAKATDEDPGTVEKVTEVEPEPIAPDKQEKVTAEEIPF